MIRGLYVAALAATLAFGQDSGTTKSPATLAQMRVNMLASRLNLTDAQKTSALSIFTNAFTASEPVRSNLKTNRQSLDDAVKKNDTAAIDQLAAASGTLHGQLIAIQSKARAAFYGLLTTEQKAMYDKMPRGRPGGRGWPGGGGGRPSRP